MTKHPKRIVLIGARGFVGGAVLAQLTRRADSKVVAVGRNITPDDVAGYANVEAVACDLRKRDQVTAVLRDADVVICCYREAGSESELTAVENLIEATKVAGVSRLIYISSIAVYGNAAGYVTEDVAAADHLDWYGRAKREAERALEAAASRALSVAVLRPSLIYGPRGREWSTDFATSVAQGHLVGLGNAADGVANLVHVDDLAAFCVALITKPLPPFVVLNVNGPAGVTFNEYFKELHAALRELSGKNPSRRPLLTGKLVRRLLRGALKAPKKLLGARLPNLELLERAAFALRARPQDFPHQFYSHRTYYSAERAVELGFTSKHTLSQGARETVTWMRSAGYL